MNLRNVLLASTLLVTSSLGAAEADIVKYRQSLMKAMTGYMNAMSAISKGTVPYRADLGSHAGSVKEVARQLPALFPATTSPDKVATDALPEVWTKAKQFAAAAKTLETEAGKLQALAKSNDTKAIAAQFDAVKKACGGCHDWFRAKEN